MTEQRVRKPGLEEMGFYDYTPGRGFNGTQPVRERLRAAQLPLHPSVITNVRAGRSEGEWTDRAVRASMLLDQLASSDDGEIIDLILARKRSVYDRLAESLDNLRTTSKWFPSRYIVSGFISNVGESLGLDEADVRNLFKAALADFASAYPSGNFPETEKTSKEFYWEFKDRYEMPRYRKPEYFEDWLNSFDQIEGNRRLGIVGILRYNLRAGIHPHIIAPLTADCLNKYFEGASALSPFDLEVLEINRGLHAKAEKAEVLGAKYGFNELDRVIPLHFRVLAGDYSLPARPNS